MLSCPSTARPACLYDRRLVLHHALHCIGPRFPYSYLALAHGELCLELEKVDKNNFKVLGTCLGIMFSIRVSLEVGYQNPGKPIRKVSQMNDKHSIRAVELDFANSSLI